MTQSMDIQIIVYKKAFIGITEGKGNPVKLPNIRCLKSVFMKSIRQAPCLPSLIHIITQQPAVRIFFCEQKIGVCEPGVHIGFVEEGLLHNRRPLCFYNRKKLLVVASVKFYFDYFFQNRIPL